MLCSKLWTVCLRNMDPVCLVKHENTTPVQYKHSSRRTWGLFCRFQVFRTHSTSMLKWISVLFSHCIKWTRVLVPLPLQHSGNVVLVKAQTVALCWRLGLPRRDQDEELQPSLCALAQQLNADQSECVRSTGQSRALPELIQHLQLHFCSLALPGPCRAQGLQGETQAGSVIALFFLTDCAGIPGLQGRVCCGQMLLGYTCAIFFNLPVFCMCWSTSLLFLILN